MESIPPHRRPPKPASLNPLSEESHPRVEDNLREMLPQLGQSRRCGGRNAFLITVQQVKEITNGVVRAEAPSQNQLGVRRRPTRC